MVDVDSELVKAFHLMWDHFPEPCALHHKSREVVAVNPACKAINREVGSICIKHGKPEAHIGCLANTALSEREAQVVRKENDAGKEKLAFWLPIDGYPDYYIHFATRNIRDYV